jgi:hypothetical protein
MTNAPALVTNADPPLTTGVRHFYTVFAWGAA